METSAKLQQLGGPPAISLPGFGGKVSFWSCLFGVTAFVTSLLLWRKQAPFNTADGVTAGKQGKITATRGSSIFWDVVQKMGNVSVTKMDGVTMTLAVSE